jgi:hypothetical protein
MAKEAKANKVSVQKGPIVAHQPTMKSMTRPEIDVEDGARHAVGRSGMNLKMMTPKR